MSDSQEFYAATVDDAVNKASTALGVVREELDFAVLDRGSSGFLGIGARDARIVVVNRAPHNVPVEASPDEPPLVPLVEATIAVPEPPQDTESPEVGPSVTASATASYDLVVAVDEFITALVGCMGFDATVDAYDAGETIAVDVAMEETGLFIGQKGETIDAIQYLLNVAVYKDRPFLKRIVVDSEGYRQRRVEALQGMAHRTARRALREKRSLSLPPMSAPERRVVHLFLKENPHVTTLSEGEAGERRVVVSPI